MIFMKNIKICNFRLDRHIDIYILNWQKIIIFIKLYERDVVKKENDDSILHQPNFLFTKL